ncbi:Fe-S protein assembly co-chaperone HscB [Pokkaliibacter sp. CJK22405]|uniref:Fe-S protein assembly co-chaperone HscB n=1 Tax=Pokkaliibacter sp. CJK22405 TaxID=3384615 RepID=UPI0039846C5A
MWGKLQHLISMDFRQNYFELFQVPVSFTVDLPLIQLRYQELQKTLHPDRHAASGAQQQRLALQYATRVNEGLATLKSPLKRAMYLLELAGMPLNSESETTRDTGFLMQQMEWREALSDAEGAIDPFPALDAVRHDVEAAQKLLVDRFVAAYEEGGEVALSQAKEYVRQMQFMHKLLAEIDAIEARLDD